MKTILSSALALVTALSLTACGSSPENSRALPTSQAPTTRTQTSAPATPVPAPDVTVSPKPAAPPKAPVTTPTPSPKPIPSDFPEDATRQEAGVSADTVKTFRDLLGPTGVDVDAAVKFSLNACVGLNRKSVSAHEVVDKALKKFGDNGGFVVGGVGGMCTDHLKALLDAARDFL